MRSRRELLALAGPVVLAIAVLLAFLFVDDRRPTTPVDRANEQNSGTDAPNEVVGPPGAENQSQ
jgi:hypothetical protein